MATFLVTKMGVWYMFTLTTPDRTAEVSAFCALAVGAWTKMLDYYMQRGNDWSARMQLNGGENSASTNITVSN